MRRTRGAGLAACLLATLVAKEGLAADPVLAAAGDIACEPESPSFNGGAGTATACRMAATSDLLLTRAPDVVMPLGDTQYLDGAADRYALSYGPSWGRLLAKTRPVVGNHEYGTPGAAGYFGYFGDRAGDPTKGWYAFEIGAWRVLVLNSNCGEAGGCAAGSEQETWLRAELAAHPGVCTLAAMHHPRFSSGTHGSDPSLSAFWDALYAAGADVVLAGHEHDYERFGMQRPDGTPDPEHGIRELVVGTGGKDARPFASVAPNSQVRLTDVFGVLELTLHPASYDFAFVDTDGRVLDAGSAPCHRAPRPRRFVPVTPCRLVDTRLDDGPALGAGESRAFTPRGACGIAEGAASVALNVTAVAPAAAGVLRVGPSGPAGEGAQVVGFEAGRTRAGHTIAWLGNDGAIAIRAELAAGAVDVVVDVSGYFE